MTLEHRQQLMRQFRRRVFPPNCPQPPEPRFRGQSPARIVQALIETLPSMELRHPYRVLDSMETRLWLGHRVNDHFDRIKVLLMAISYEIAPGLLPAWRLIRHSWTVILRSTSTLRELEAPVTVREPKRARVSFNEQPELL